MFMYQHYSVEFDGVVCEHLSSWCATLDDFRVHSLVKAWGSWRQASWRGVLLTSHHNNDSTRASSQPVFSLFSLSLVFCLCLLSSNTRFFHVLWCSCCRLQMRLLLGLLCMYYQRLAFLSYFCFFAFIVLHAHSFVCNVL